MSRILLFVLLFLLPSIVKAQDTVRVCTYNLLLFGTTVNTHDRLDEFRMILNEIKPDVLMVQEVQSREAWRLFQDSVLLQLDKPLANPCDNCTLNDQDSYVVSFWDTTAFDRPLGIRIKDSLRDQTGPLLVHRETGDSVWFIGAHWKAGDTREDEIMRDSSGSILVRYLGLDPLGEQRHVIVAGDFNVYSSTEPGYQHLLTRLTDPINRPGDWHDNADFADVHTQSTRARQFGGGVHGGMDDRFDQILLTPAMTARYVAGSYTAFGNDGKHFNDSINAQPNTAVTPAMAQALHDASDHLPVYLDVIFPKKTVSVKEEEPLKYIIMDLW